MSENLTKHSLHIPVQGFKSSSSSSSSLAKQLILSHSLLPDLVFSSLDFATIFFFYTASNPSTWKTRSLYLCPPVIGWPSYIPPGTGFPIRRLLRLAELRWRYSYPPPHECQGLKCDYNKERYKETCIFLLRPPFPYLSKYLRERKIVLIQVV
jgi:hypothetical protein